MTLAGEIGPSDATSLTVFLDLCCFFFTPNLCMTPCHPLPFVIAATSIVAPVSKI